MKSIEFYEFSIILTKPHTEITRAGGSEKSSAQHKGEHRSVADDAPNSRKGAG